jgi:Outer membrane protein beta-barrel domain
MKSILLSLFILAATLASAQRNKVNEEQENFFRIGAKAGVNANKITGTAFKNGFNYNFQAGLFAQINFSSRFGIQPEINFVQSKSEFTNDPTEIYDDLFRDGSQKLSTLNYLEIPLLLNVNVGESKRVKLQVGPAFGGLLKQTIDSLKAKTDLYKKSDISAIAGLWVQLPFFNFGARFKQGLSNINAVDNRQTWKSQSIQVFVGISF